MQGPSTLVARKWALPAVRSCVLPAVFAFAFGLSASAQRGGGGGGHMAASGGRVGGFAGGGGMHSGFAGGSSPFRSAPMGGSPYEARPGLGAPGQFRSPAAYGVGSYARTQAGRTAFYPRGTAFYGNNRGGANYRQPSRVGPYGYGGYGRGYRYNRGYGYGYPGLYASGLFYNPYFFDPFFGFGDPFYDDDPGFWDNGSGSYGDPNAGLAYNNAPYGDPGQQEAGAAYGAAPYSAPPDDGQPPPEYSPRTEPRPWAQPSGFPRASAPLRQEDPVTIVFKDGRPAEHVRNYALTRSALLITDERMREIPLDQIDLAATQRVNRAEGVDFRLPQAN